jgi:hypothetical protein
MARAEGKTPPNILPVKLAEFDSKFYNQIINHGELNTGLFTEHDVYTLIDNMAGVFLAVPARSDPRYEQVARLALEARQNLAENKEHRVVSLWYKHLRDLSYPNSPVTFFVPLWQYPKISLHLSQRAVHTLVWALNRSPLLATAAYDQPGLLLPHEIAFQNLPASRKHRLVIFRDSKEVAAYANCDASYHKVETRRTINKSQLQERKKYFEESVCQHGGQLWYTTRERARDLVPAERAKHLGEDYWDFGFVKDAAAEDAEFLFVSGFNSASFKPSATAFLANDLRHLTLYAKPHRQEYEDLRRLPAYSCLFGPLHGLCELVAELIVSTHNSSSTFVDKANIQRLI